MRDELDGARVVECVVGEGGIAGFGVAVRCFLKKGADVRLVRKQFGLRVLETSLEGRFGKAQPSGDARRWARHNFLLSGVFEDIFIMGEKVVELVVDGLHADC